MSDEFSKAEWDDYAEYYDSLKELRPYAQMLDDVAFLLTGAQGPWLDAGCGTGNLPQRLGKKIAGEKFIGIDTSEPMLSRARSKCPSFTFQIGNLDSRIPFDDQVFLTVVCINALYAVADPKKTLEEFRRLLHPGGLLVLVTPKSGYENGLILKAHSRSDKPDEYWKAMHASFEREERLVREAITDPRLAERFLHVARFNRVISKDRKFHFFTEADLSELVESNGFKVTSTKLTYAEQNLLLAAKRS